MTKDCSWNCHENYKRRTCAELVFFTVILLSYSGLIDAKIRASDKDLPVMVTIQKSKSDNKN